MNRATLARQTLLERRRLSPLPALCQLAGLQAQAPNPPYFALLARLQGFERPQLTRLVESGKLVRMTMHRSSLHLLPADEALSLRSALHPVQVRTLKASHGRLLNGLDLDAMCVVAHQDRTRFLQEKHKRHIFTTNGIVRDTAWCDGRVVGTWHITGDAKRALLTVRLFDQQPRKVREALTDESRRVLLAAHAALRHEVTVVCGD